MIKNFKFLLRVDVFSNLRKFSSKINKKVTRIADVSLKIFENFTKDQLNHGYKTML